MLSLSLRTILLAIFLLSSTSILSLAVTPTKSLTNAERIKRGLPLKAPVNLKKRSKKPTRLRARGATASNIPALQLAPSTSSSQKFVVSHHIVGLTYPYENSDWDLDIRLAAENGINAFALNIGTDDWQLTGPSATGSRPGSGILPAYAAAARAGNGFKTFISFDMSVFDCTSQAMQTMMVEYVQATAGLPSQFMYQGRPLVTAFGAEQYRGQACPDSFYQGFRNRLKMGSPSIEIVFVPTFFIDPAQLFQRYPSTDGLLHWNSAWSMTTGPPTVDSDNSYKQSIENSAAAAGRSNPAYQSAVAPAFFTHFSYKNWIYYSDNWVFKDRWDQVISIREKLDIVTVTSWNDYGESHYIGPVHGDPGGANWAGPVGSDNHAAVRAVNKFYSQWYITGVRPAVTDRIFLQARPHVRDATASDDPVTFPSFGPSYLNGYMPDGRRVQVDSFFALVFASAPGTVTLSSGTTSSQTFDVQAGITKLSLPLVPSAGMRAVLTRSSVDVVTVVPDFIFAPSTTTYNFNPLFFSS